MALFTKAQVRTAVRQAFDDANSKRWSDANLDVLISLVQDTMFQAILDTFEDATSQSETVAPDANGIFDTTSFTKRFYRVQLATRMSDSKLLHPKLRVEKVPQPAYYMIGSRIVTEPVVTGASSLKIDYSFLPTKFTDLATDTTVLADYPEGHEAALIYLSAAWAITKGDAESMAQIGRIADTAVEALLTHIARPYPIGAQQRVAQVKAALMRNPLVSPSVQQR